MQVVDANVLLYAINRDAHHHQAARSWLDAALSGAETVGFAWTVLLAFIRIATRPAVFSKPLTHEMAIEIVGKWLQQPAAVLVSPSARHLDLLAGMLGEVGSAGNLVNDAHLAALALEHGASVVSFDGDFARLGVTWTQPATT